MRDPKDVRVYGKGRLLEDYRHNNVGALAANTGKRFQLFACARNVAAVQFHQLL